jgi:hypothetical protein
VVTGGRSFVDSRFQKTNVVGIEISNQSVLILDEVDGMSAGDRGGIGAINALIRKTKVNIYLYLCDEHLHQNHSDSHYLYLQRSYSAKDEALARNYV